MFLSQKGACTSKFLETSILLELGELSLRSGLDRTLLVNQQGLEHAKNLVAAYKQGKIRDMNAELWKAKKIVDSTLHPGWYCKWHWTRRNAH